MCSTNDIVARTTHVPYDAVNVRRDLLRADQRGQSFFSHVLKHRCRLRSGEWLEPRCPLLHNGFADRCSDETAYSTGTGSVARALEVLVNQYDWLPGPLTFRVVKRLKFSAVGIVGINTGIREPPNYSPESTSGFFLTPMLARIWRRGGDSSLRC